MRQRFLITGGTGLVGKYLIKILVEQGHEIAVLTRKLQPNTEFVSYYYWDVFKGEIDEKCLESVSVIFHLAGENVAASRWTENRKEIIRNSRVLGTRLLWNLLRKNPHAITTIVAASAVGYYGNTTSSIVFDENQQPGTDFLAQVCVAWENEVFEFQKTGIRTVILRTGVVLAKEGGALQKMLIPFKFGLGAALGSGKQFMPWIHIEDLCAMYLFALENPQIAGVYNAVVNDAPSNEVFSRSIAKLVKRPYLGMRIPAFVMEVFLGEMAGMLLEGSRVSSQKIIETGYVFKHPKLLLALDNLLR